MRRQIVVFLITLLLTNIGWFFTTYAFMAYRQTEQTSETERAHDVNVKVVNIKVGKMDKEYIYADDGRKFSISSNTEIIDNTTGKSNKIRTATLIFKNNQLIAIILK